MTEHLWIWRWASLHSYLIWRHLRGSAKKDNKKLPHNKCAKLAASFSKRLEAIIAACHYAVLYAEVKYETNPFSNKACEALWTLSRCTSYMFPYLAILALQTCGSWEETDDIGTDVTGLAPWGVPPPDLWRWPWLAEAVVGEALDPECLLMDEVLIRLVLVLLLLLGVFWLPGGV